MRIYQATAMAHSKQDAKTRIGDLAFSLADHLMYLIFFDSKENNKHWRNEVSAMLHRVFILTKIRGSKGVVHLTHDELMSYLYSSIWEGFEEDTLRAIHDSALHHNKKLKPCIELYDSSISEKKFMHELKKMYSGLISIVLLKDFTCSKVEMFLKEQVLVLRKEITI